MQTLPVVCKCLPSLVPPLQLLSFSLEETLSPPAAFELPTKNKKHKEKKNTLELRTILPHMVGRPQIPQTYIAPLYLH